MKEFVTTKVVATAILDERIGNITVYWTLPYEVGEIVMIRYSCKNAADGIWDMGAFRVTRIVDLVGDLWKKPTWRVYFEVI